MKLFKKGDLVGVEWEDSTSWTERWVEIDQYVRDGKDTKGMMVQSAGIVLDHRKTHILLAGSVHIGRASEVHRIPTSAIRRISRLTAKGG